MIDLHLSANPLAWKLVEKFLTANHLRRGDMVTLLALMLLRPADFTVLLNLVSPLVRVLRPDELAAFRKEVEASP